ncbi:phage tail protein [Clostridium novyi]|uniref:phage tail protein n=1 Tax=Clostridium novyi TaxID=1542 RepID=UPI0004D7378E|nr:phage tail protein [Clostridium novyi]KEH84609.1 tail fiber protein H [Clostridium novyi A str. NCTC 538]
MAEQFYTILTAIGKAKMANTTALGTKVNLTKFQVGDGNGTYYNPTEDQTGLKHKTWEGPISSITVDENNPNWIVIEVIIPSNVGGFMIREAGVFDDEGNMIAIGKYPETYKPVASNGSTKDLIIKMILEVSNTSSVTLKVDPTVILATQKDIQTLNNRIGNIKVPVQSVNSKTGVIELKAVDIKTADGTNLEEFKKKTNSQYEKNKNKLNNFGGRNYLMNSNFRRKETGWITYKNGEGCTIKFNDGNVVINNVSRNFCGIYQSIKDICVQKSQKYIISFYAKADKDLNILCGWTSHGVNCRVRESNDYIRYSISIGNPQNDNEDTIIVYNATQKSNVEITKIQVECGDVVSDWNLAPEEVIANSYRLDAIEKILINKGYMTVTQNL